MTRTQNGLILLLAAVMISYSSCQEDNASPTCESDNVFADTCIAFLIDELMVTPQGDQFVLTNNTNFTIAFENLAEAQTALEVIEHYNLIEYYRIGEDTTFSYFLSDHEIPSGEIAGEDCTTLELCNLQIKLTSPGKYTVVETLSIGDKWLYASSSQDTAHQILQTILFYQPTRICYVGRPNTKMHYLRK